MAAFRLLRVISRITLPLEALGQPLLELLPNPALQLLPLLQGGFLEFEAKAHRGRP
jgi:hypothetical protein